MIRFSRHYNFFIDIHDDQKPQRFHTMPTPRAGGIGIMAGLTPLLFTSLGWKLFIPLILAFASGILEDFSQNLSPGKRLLMQLVAAFGAILLTGTIVDYLGFGIRLPYAFAMIFSAFAIVGAMNAINIIDGFNGLASGMVLLILLSFGITALRVDAADLLILNLIAFLSVSGFAIFNFPAGRIFLGDGGAYLLGFFVAIDGILLAGRYDDISPWYILAVLIYPVWEVVFSIFRKRAEGRSPLQPDRMHMHMLIYRHVTHTNPTTSLLVLSAVAPFLIAATLYPNNSIFNFTLCILFICLYLLIYRRLRNTEKQSGDTL